MTTMTSPTTTRRIFREDGQSIVEFAFVMPFLVFLLLAITQFGLAFHNYLSITDAARVGARAAAVNRTTGACTAARTAIQNTVSSEQWSVISSRITCTAGANVGDPVTISINYPFSIGLPGFFGLPAMSISGNMPASARERLE
jgi:Flp pilus assembly protein TadG